MSQSNDPKQESSFRKTRNVQANQQSVFLALINKYFTITLISPKKRSTVAQQMVTIQNIQYKDDIVEVEEFIIRRLKEINVRDISNGVSSKTASRRWENNKIAEINNLLIDILKELGYSFNSKLTNGKSTTVKNEIVSSILFNGKLILTSEQINIHGKSLNNSLNSLFVDNKIITLNRNDPFFNDFFALT
ncbi:hypothetical protein EHI8A_174860 [Entamoeba histolytica HM-1:IMSS-B]|uniref:Uncharacterized protein n=5 Tax=Entamoeba histolytica TaxID=5759 RepID=C4MAX6_ENTH1|nr:hypothetical protein EHI_029390 [Entamoeba histolytica HM-1:IMSS]EMD43425.1 TATA-binding associated phosphoprotein, putative [Entamoeba histolytica KU27]EMH72589.1 hypothetical protein EHI8A_174860 [Entamoeba histolytica HM-1:IMSS-B]EMS15480.1 TATA-binding protein-associated phosphoprotein, putative [Entamoeba histolytica HM-3:IMSS]GAT99019.1 hypothetical protein CL6EHI_029390 [Entamoeba histolytica]EAL44177.1 hypothetical protein EHI_029390 [Entamoeba histolytica HM-1:IMSS]|eukprot:XP_649563.1 hypothetical protein EHI_029390 [Entamoeba histolytica HM-1:IMSS]